MQPLESFESPLRLAYLRVNLRELERLRTLGPRFIKFLLEPFPPDSCCADPSPRPLQASDREGPNRFVIAWPSRTTSCGKSFWVHGVSAPLARRQRPDRHSTCLAASRRRQKRGGPADTPSSWDWERSKLPRTPRAETGQACPALRGSACRGHPRRFAATCGGVRLA